MIPWWSWRHVIDYAVVIGLGVGALLLDRCEPHNQLSDVPLGAQLNPNFLYPYKQNTVPSSAAAVLAYIPNVIVCAFIQIPFKLFSLSAASAVNGAAGGGVSGGGLVMTEWWIGHDVHHAMLGLLESAALNHFVTNGAKVFAGRLRPHYWARAQLNDVAQEKDARKSFPSGHSSTVFHGLFFLSLYLAGKLGIFSNRNRANNNTDNDNWRGSPVFVPPHKQHNKSSKSSKSTTTTSSTTNNAASTSGGATSSDENGRQHYRGRVGGGSSAGSGVVIGGSNASIASSTNEEDNDNGKEKRERRKAMMKRVGMMAMRGVVEGGDFWKVVVCGVPLGSAFIVAITRTRDYHHNYDDITAGAVIGLITGFVGYFTAFPRLSSKTCHVPKSLTGLSCLSSSSSSSVGIVFDGTPSVSSVGAAASNSGGGVAPLVSVVVESPSPLSPLPSSPSVTGGGVALPMFPSKQSSHQQKQQSQQQQPQLHGVSSSSSSSSSSAAPSPLVGHASNGGILEVNDIDQPSVPPSSPHPSTNINTLLVS